MLSYEFQGRVLDHSNNEPLPLATVYLNNTTIGTSTDLEGNFTLLFSGSYEELIVSFVGYEVITHQIDKTQLDKRYVFKLMPSQHMLNESFVKEQYSESWYKNVAFFTERFLGDTKASKHTKILNPESLYFNKNGSLLQAFAREPLIVENEYLGYRIHYLLISFDYDSQDKLMSLFLKLPKLSMLSEGGKSSDIAAPKS